MLPRIRVRPGQSQVGEVEAESNVEDHGCSTALLRVEPPLLGPPSEEVNVRPAALNRWNTCPYPFPH